MNRYIQTTFMASTIGMALLLTGGCGDKPAADGGETGTGEETATETADDDVGESGTATTTTTTTDDADTDDTLPTTDDDSCPIGAEGCPCTGGGGCDPGLVCDEGICGTPNDTADTETTDATDTDTTDTTDTDTTETTDTGGQDPYQACPGGDDSECAPGEVCVTGDNNGMEWSMCTSGECGDDDECAVDDNDFCNDLPGDGEPLDYCVPLACGFMQPECPDGMFCAQPFGMGQAVCVWGG